MPGSVFTGNDCPKSESRVPSNATVKQELTTAKLVTVTQLSENQLNQVFISTAKAISRIINQNGAVIMDLGLLSNEVIIFSKNEVQVIEKLKLKDQQAMN